MTHLEIDRLFRLEPFERSRMHPRRVLFVQTDWEMGLARLAMDLEDQGHKVFKVALNFSDLYFKFKGIPTLAFNQPREQFREWLTSFIEDLEIDTIVVYNPFRPYNRIACEIAKENGLGVVQFDQGLLRPLHVSVFFGSELPFQQIRNLWNEADGNGNWPAPNPPEPDATVSTGRKNSYFAFSVFVTLLFSFRFPHYKDQQEMSLRKHLWSLFLNGVRFLKRANEASRYSPLISDQWSGKFFLVPLQLEHDAQIRLNSPFSKIEEMMDLVADSFMKRKDPEDRLVFKIHPLDRGYRTFEEKFQEIRDKVGKDRVFMVDRVPLDLLLENAKGVVTVNSTVGLTALRHLTPVKTLGNAFYDLKHLSFQGELDDFWDSPAQPKRVHVKQFINLLEMTVQGRGTLSRRCYRKAGHAGILWPTQFGKTFGLNYFLFPEPQACPEKTPASNQSPAALPH